MMAVCRMRMPNVSAGFSQYATFWKSFDYESFVIVSVRRRGRVEIFGDKNTRTTDHPVADKRKNETVVDDSDRVVRRGAVFRNGVH